MLSYDFSNSLARYLFAAFHSGVLTFIPAVRDDALEAQACALRQQDVGVREGLAVSDQIAFARWVVHPVNWRVQPVIRAVAIIAARHLQRHPPRRVHSLHD